MLSHSETLAETILQEFHVHQKDHPEQEKKHIIKAAAKLIKNDIKLVETSTEHYPPVDEIETEDRCLNFLPDTLKLLLEGILTGKDIKIQHQRHINAWLCSVTVTQILLSVKRHSILVRAKFYKKAKTRARESRRLVTLYLHSLQAAHKDARGLCSRWGMPKSVDNYCY